MELLVTLFSTVGSAGFGSVLKLLSGLIQSRRDAKLANMAAMSKNVASFQAIFGKDGMSKASAMTRRYIALILISGGTYMACYSVMNAAQPFITFVLPEMREGFQFLFIKFPPRKGDTTVTLTLGHVALMYLNIVALSAGFYFTPAGSK